MPNPSLASKHGQNMAYCIRTPPATHFFVYEFSFFTRGLTCHSDFPGSAQLQRPYYDVAPGRSSISHLPPAYRHTKLVFTSPFQECLSPDSSDDGYQKMLVGLSTDCGKSMEPSMYSLIPDAPCRLVPATYLSRVGRSDPVLVIAHKSHGDAPHRFHGSEQ